MPRLSLFLLLGLALAPAAWAQSDTDDQLDLIVQIEPFAHVVSLDDQDGAADSDLVFDFAPGLDDTDPTAPAGTGSTLALSDRITFATNLDFAHQVDIAVEAASAGDWNDLSITVTPGAISTINTSTSTSGTPGSCGAQGGAVTLTADDTEIAAASGITLCHATQVIGYSVELDDLTADEADRSFDVTYTILQTAAPTFPGG